MSAPTIDDAIEALRKLKPERQNALAGYILALAVDERHPEPIDPDDLLYVTEALGQAQRGEFASNDDVTAAFDRFGG